MERRKEGRGDKKRGEEKGKREEERSVFTLPVCQLCLSRDDKCSPSGRSVMFRRSNPDSSPLALRCCSASTSSFSPPLQRLSLVRWLPLLHASSLRLSPPALRPFITLYHHPSGLENIIHRTSAAFFLCVWVSCSLTLAPIHPWLALFLLSPSCLYCKDSFRCSIREAGLYSIGAPSGFTTL